MKKICLSVFLLTFTGTLLFLSCQKELSCYDCKDNRPPIANAGADQIIVLPKDSATLDGTASSDPGGTIVKYKWMKVSGPVSSSILQTDSSKTLVRPLAMGIYKFELTVTDNGGLSAKDTVQIIVNDPAHNQPPVANAGIDQTITLPIDTASLNGNLSFDPDGTIVSYQWTKISGPSSFNILNSNSVQTKVNGLVQGVYQFELRVTDNGGLFSKDSIVITVLPLVTGCDISNRSISNASFTSSIQLPEPRYGIMVAAAGNKILIAGGYTSYINQQAANLSSRVDIYDVTTSQWSITQLSEPCAIGTIAVLGNKIFFAGGLNANGLRTRVDIYDISSNTWSIAQLSQARPDIAGGSINNKVFFVGGLIDWGAGNFSSVVDIYDAVTNSWSTASLSKGRYSINDLEKITPTVIGNRIFFAGGSCNNVGGDCSSNRIDVYDAVANTWSYEDYVSQNPPWSLFPGVAAGDKNYFVTGDYWQGGNMVEIRDEITHTTTYECLSGTLYETPFKNDNKLIFPVSTISRFTPDYKLTQFDVYDLSTNVWSISKLTPPGVDQWSPFISVNNEVYAMDGYSPATTGFLYDKIKKLDF